MYNKVQVLGLIFGILALTVVLSLVFDSKEKVTFDSKNILNRIDNLERDIREGDNLTLGATNFFASGFYRLSGSGVDSDDATITLQSFQVPVTEDNVSMSMFGDVGYITLDPGNISKKELISFSGVTQNANGTAVLTGVTRGLLPFSDYTASTSYQQAHSGGSIAIVSNPPQLYSRALFIDNDATISGVLAWLSTTTPHFVYNPVWGDQGSTTFASKGYVDDIATAGAADLDLTTKGVGEQATNTEASLNAADGSGDTTAPLVITTELTSATTYAYAIPVARDDGDIDINAIPLQSDDTWIFLGNATFSANFTATSSIQFGQPSVSTTSIVMFNGVNSNSFTLAVASTTASYTLTMPLADGFRQQFVQTDGSGQLSFAVPYPDIVLPLRGISSDIVTASSGADSLQTMSVGLFDGVNSSVYSDFTFVHASTTINSIFITCTQTGASTSAGNVVIDYISYEYNLSGATTSDTIGNTTVSDWSSTSTWLAHTIPTTIYDGLTQGRYWGFRITRKGGDGSDNLPVDLHCPNIVIDFDN